MILFIVSDTYTTRTLLHCIDYIFSNNVTEIYLLSENHALSEFCDIKHVKITLVDNVDKAANICDVLLLVINHRLDLYKAQLIEKTAKNNNKRIIKIDMNIKESTRIFKELCVQNRKSMILILGIGDYTQLCATEILIYEILHKKSNRIKQIFSQTTKILLEKINKITEHNGEITKMLSANEDESELLILSVECSDLFSLDNKCFEWLKPDFVLLQTDNRMTVNEDLCKRFLIKYEFPIDFVIRSEFTTIYSVLDVPFPLYFKKRKIDDVVSCPVKYIYDDDLPEKLLNNICSKLYIPDDIEIIEV